MTSPSDPREATFYGGPLDGSVYERRSKAFPEKLEMTIGDRSYLYRCSVKVDANRLQVLYRLCGCVQIVEAVS